MILSVVNRTKSNKLKRKDVQKVIRAVNRQLQEDFKLYWHKDVQLRLEGKAHENSNPSNPVDMRGDAVIYLMDEVDEEDALGYHDINFRGIPYGFVFISLSDELREHWSVTLSHEALELAMDPEVNLFARGPHPDDPTREVLHWYELCDAVQDEFYEIDGVEVSNFVLPLYFTLGEEADGHNDFLGTIRGGERLPSFGLTKGGYLGFFDPELGEHDTYRFPDDLRARERMEIKFRAQGTRRALRYQAMKGRSPEKDGVPKFDAFTIELDPNVNGNPQRRAERLLSHLPGKNWECKKVEGNASGMEFDLVGTGIDGISPGHAWDLHYKLRQLPGVVSCEVSFLEPQPGMVDEMDRSHSRGRRASSIFGGGDKDGTNEYLWSLSNIKADDAWKLPPKPSGRSFGEGILVGHPDSGFISHPELNPDRLRLTADWDFVEGDDNPEHSGGAHGLGTASVIMSGHNKPNGHHAVYGVAPQAELMPLRVTRKWVLLFFGGPRRLRDAIYHAVDNNCHVISISLGGLPLRSLKKAIQYAVSKDVIVLAAAGNEVRIVAWPARYDEVIAVAGSNFDDEPWFGTSRGDDVDISAPGESVWKAIPGEMRAKRGNGTSFSVAMTSGAAALWLAHHGRDKLIRHFGRGNLVEGFRSLLKKTARQTNTIHRGSKFGDGILNVEALLLAPLPRVARTRRSRSTKAKTKTKKPELHSLYAFFQDEEIRLDGVLKKVTHRSTKNELDQFLDECGDELTYQCLYQPQVLAGLRKACHKICHEEKHGRKKMSKKKNKQTGKRQVSSRLANQIELLI